MWARKPPWIHHDGGADCVKGFHYPHLGVGPLNGLSDAVGVADCERWREAAGSIKGISHVQEDLAVQGGVAGFSEDGQGHSTGCGIHDQLGLCARFRERARTGAWTSLLGPLLALGIAG